MDVENNFSNSAQDNLDSLDNPESIMEDSESSSSPGETVSETVSVLTREDIELITTTLQTGFQQNHVDYIMIQGELEQDIFGASLMLCGCLCASILFRGFFKHD